MLNNIYKYILATSVLFLLLFTLFNYLFLPWYVGSGNDYYLPDLRGLYLQKAKHTLNKLGFNVIYSELPFSDDFIPGTVIKMSPRAFTKVKSGRTINLIVASHRKEFIMPNYKSASYRNAKILVKEADLFLDTTIYEYNDQYLKGTVSFQLPKSGRIISSGTYVTLGISKGAAPDYFNVPDIVGLSLIKGRKSIIQSGFHIGNLEYEYQPKLLINTIIDQSMTPGMKVSVPTKIDLIISKDKE